MVQTAKQPSIKGLAEALAGGEKPTRLIKAIASARGYKGEIGRRELADLLASRTPMGMLVAGDLGGVLAETADRVVVDTLKQTPPTWPLWAAEATIDRLTGTITTITPGGALPVIPEFGSYQDLKFEGGATAAALSKRGAKFSVSFEMVCADDQQAIQAGLRGLARAAVESEDDVAYSALAGGTWPAASGDAIGPPSAASLNALISLLAAQTGPDGGSLHLRPGALLCPSALTATAAGALYEVNATLAPEQRITLVPEPRLTGTAWYLTARKEQLPPVACVFLRSERQPTIVQKQKGDTYQHFVRHAMTAVVVSLKGAASNAGTLNQ